MSYHFSIYCYFISILKHSTVGFSSLFSLRGMWGSERVRDTPKATQLVTASARLQSSSFWLEAPALLFAAVPGKAVLEKAFLVSDCWIHLESPEAFKPATQFLKSIPVVYFLCRHLLPDDWDEFAGDKTRLTYFNLMAGFWHTYKKEKKVHKGQNPQLYWTQSYFVLGNLQVLQPNIY